MEVHIPHKPVETRWWLAQWWQHYKLEVANPGGFFWVGGARVGGFRSSFRACGGIWERRGEEINPILIFSRCARFELCNV